ncbi:protein LURP-one-related 10 isoform X2 [Lactuca sativa]|uniref:protein LURP-one-related 10 isoform X2 n=1 Tax=Lactuca sativa TaxID=4236 RepID=UPI0022AFB34C|nr:protein LURP-one-related 10 isoform X2 [Lactuca sativa]
MAQPNKAPSSSPVCVIGSHFMVPQQLDLIVDRISSGILLITDINHKIIFKVKPCDSFIHERRVLLDVDDQPIVAMRDKSMTVHDGWYVFRGDSRSKSDMIFTTKKPRMIQLFKSDVNVFLANKTCSKNVCDFKVKGSWSKRNCTIYMGDTSTTIAQMSKMQLSENIVKFVNEKFKVTISPNVDFTFVITIIAIIEAMEDSGKKNKGVVQVVGGVTEVAGTILLL